MAAISLLLLRQKDAVGLVRFDDAVRTVLPPRSRMTHWQRILSHLGDAGTGVATAAPDALAQAASLVRRPGLIVLVSDLLLDPEPVLAATRTLRAMGHDIVVLHIMDPAERELAEPGDALFTDPESGDALAARGADVREAYRETVEVAIGEWRDRFVAAGASYEVVMTSEPFGVALRRAFAVRQGMP